MSQQSVPLLSVVGYAAAAITDYTFVGPDGTVTATAAANALGVADAVAAGTGDAYKIVVMGTARVRCAAAIAKGAAIDVGATGQATTHAAGIPVARALEAAAGAGSIIEVLLIPN